MSITTERQIRSYKFLRAREREGTPFSLAELAHASQWAISTVRTYLPKKWDGYISLHPSGLYVVKGILEMSQKKYLDMMSQVNSKILKSK